MSAAIGAFLVGLALSGSVQSRGPPPLSVRSATCSPPRSSSSSRSRSTPAISSGCCSRPPCSRSSASPASCSRDGWRPDRSGAGRRGRIRAGTALIARGEFSIVIAALGAATTDGAHLGALAAAYVLITAIVGPLAAKYADPLADLVT